MRLKVSNVCQLLGGYTYYGDNRNGIKITNNGDGTFTVNGTATIDSWFLQPVFQLQTSNPGYHTYLLDIGQYSGNANAHGVVYFYDDNVDSSVALIGTEDSSAVIRKKNGPIAGRGTIIQARFAIVVLKGVTVTNWTIRPQLFDLTEMYGAGNEPTTVAQFRQDFPNEMYEYSPVCWKRFRRLKYIANKEPVQLLDKSTYKNAIHHGITYTPNIEDGTWTITGTGTNFSFCSIQSLRVGVDFEVGDKLLLRNSSRNDTTYFPFAPYYDSNNKYLGEKDGDGIFTILNNTVRIHIQLTTRVTGVALNITTQVQVFNLTRMYGKGNEPTVAEFVAQYPGFDYSVNKYNYLTLNRGKYIANKEPVQLLDKSKFPATLTKGGVTFTNNGDGTITANGTSTKNYASYSITKIPRPPIGHKILILPDNNDKTQDHIYISGGNDKGAWVDELGYGGLIMTITGVGYLKRPYTSIGISLNVNKDWVMNNHIYKPQLFDLTAMYGAGNEPKTVAQFRADFPNELYDYNPYNAITFR